MVGLPPLGHAAAGPTSVPVIVTITTTFLRPFAPRDIEATATVVRAGRKIFTLRCELGNLGEAAPCALSLATYAVRLTS